MSDLSPVDGRIVNRLNAELSAIPVPPRRQTSAPRAVRTRRLSIAAAVLAFVLLPVGIVVAQGGLANVIPVFIRQPSRVCALY